MKLKSILSECWTGYKQVGMKNKGGRQVPNCVPESMGESELKGYLAADVVDDIVKSISSKFIKGHVEDAPNRNYIYLKLTDKKFAGDVIKVLKSKFGIDGKYDKTFGYMPSISFPSKKVISEAQAVSGGKVHKFITGKNLGFKGKKYSEIDFETLGVDNKNGTIRLKILAPKEIFGNEMSLDFRTVRRGPFFKTDTGKLNELKLNEVSYNVKADNPYQFTNGAVAVLGKYLRDEKLESGVKNTLQRVVRDLEDLRKYFFARKDESINEDSETIVREAGSKVPKIFVKTAAVEKKIKELMADRKRAVVPYNKEIDPKKKEILKQVLIKLTSQIKGYERNLIQLRDMEEEYIQKLNADAELEVESILSEKQFKGLEGVN